MFGFLFTGPLYPDGLPIADPPAWPWRLTDDPEAEYDHPLEPVDGPRATCPDCGSQLLGRGTLTHNDDGSHGWSPDEAEVPA